MEKLPDYMKLCFYVLNNTLNEIALDTLKEQRTSHPFLPEKNSKSRSDELLALHELLSGYHYVVLNA
uniref:Uncharacterized protein n=1 Tax=Quercus lobata TaxID=97700 RepID=A0A7N2R771_QUELO